MLIIIYQYQALILSSESILNLVTLFGIIGISFFYLVKTIATKKIYKAGIIKPILILSISFVLYYIINPRKGIDFNSINTVKIVLFVLFSFFPVYYWTATNRLDFQKLRFFVFSVFIFSTIQYFNGSFLENELMDMNKSANNISYTFVSLIPIIILLFWDKRKILFSLLIPIFFLTILGLKRGAIICLFGSTIILIFNIFKSQSKKNDVRNFLLLILTLCIVSLAVYYLYDNNPFLQRRFQETLAGGSSARDLIYSNIFYSWYNSNDIFYKLFGGGLDFSVIITGGFAHNDWLEILSSMGLLGIILYLSLNFSLLSLLKKNHSKPNKIVLYTLSFSWLIMSIFSMFLYSTTSYLFMIPLAIIYAKKVNRKSNQLNKKQNNKAPYTIKHIKYK